MEEKFITNLDELENLKAQEKFTFIYYKNDQCSVCGSLLPQLTELTNRWGEDVFVVDCFEFPDIAAQTMVLSVPALKVYFDNQEVISMIRFVDLLKLETDYFRLKKILG